MVAFLVRLMLIYLLRVLADQWVIWALGWLLGSLDILLELCFRTLLFFIGPFGHRQ